MYARYKGTGVICGCYMRVRNQLVCTHTPYIFYTISTLCISILSVVKTNSYKP